MSPLGTTATFSPERVYVRTPPENRPSSPSVGSRTHSRPGPERRLTRISDPNRKFVTRGTYALAVAAATNALSSHIRLVSGIVQVPR